MNSLTMTSGLVPERSQSPKLHLGGEAEPDRGLQLQDALQEAKKLSETQGDKVTLSAKGRSMASAAQKQKESEPSSPEEMAIERLKERIEQIKEEIQEAQRSNLPEKEKQQKVAQLQQELTQYMQQLAKLQKEKSGSNIPAGGTPAQVFQNSLT